MGAGRWTRLGWGAAILAAVLAAGAFAAPLKPRPAVKKPYVAPDGRSLSQLIAAHVLPDPRKTPGAFNPDVTQDTIKTTICTHGWAATVRPPHIYMSELKHKHVPKGHKSSEYEFDHLYSIEDGGAADDMKNLWMEVYADRYGARVKDRLEKKIARLVCAGEITLKAGQRAISPNWLIGYEKYVGPLPKEIGEHAPDPHAWEDAAGDPEDRSAARSERLRIASGGGGSGGGSRDRSDRSSYREPREREPREPREPREREPRERGSWSSHGGRSRRW